MKHFLKLAIVSALASTSAMAANYWWEEDNCQVGGKAQVYSVAEETQAFAYAEKSSPKKGIVGTNVWMNENFREGPNTAYGLTRTQSQFAQSYSELETKSGTAYAQTQAMLDNNLPDDDLMDYVLLLSTLDR